VRSVSRARGSCTRSRASPRRSVVGRVRRRAGANQTWLTPATSAEFGTRLLSDQLSDYRVDDLYIQAHLHGPSSRLVLDLDDSPNVLRDEEVAGSNPVTPTVFSLVSGLTLSRKDGRRQW
jgi:hypothetical protein